MEEAVNNVRDRINIARKQTKPFLTTETALVRDAIVKRFYSGHSASSLGRRTGRAARGWTSKVTGKGDDVVGTINNDVPYADHRKRKVIRPKKSTYLAIPIGEGLTATGRPRYTGPKDPRLDDKKTFVTLTDAGHLLIMRQKTKKNVETLFLLKKKVIVPARLKDLDAFIDRRFRVVAIKYTKFIEKILK